MSLCEFAGSVSFRDLLDFVREVRGGFDRELIISGIDLAGAAVNQFGVEPTVNEALCLARSLVERFWPEEEAMLGANEPGPLPKLAANGEAVAFADTILAEYETGDDEPALGISPALVLMLIQLIIKLIRG